MIRYNPFTALLLLFCSALLNACSNSIDSASFKPTPFVFNKLNLQHRHSDGSLSWDLQSSEAQYDLSNRLIKAIKPSGRFYSNNQAKYSLVSELVTILDDGDYLLLEGNIKLKMLSNEKFELHTNRMNWIPNDSLIEVLGNFVLLDEYTRVQGQSALLNQLTSDLELSGPLLIKRWTNSTLMKNDAQYNLKTSNGLWNLVTGDLSANGPISGNWKRNIDSLLTYISGTKLIGNSKNGYITIHSCTLVQPEETLSASFCTWNWNNKKLFAEGNVRVTQASNGLTTTANELLADFDKQGRVTFSSKDSKVKSNVLIDNTNGKLP